MSEEPRHYISWLLRLWQTEGDKGPVWSASVDDPQSGERIGLAIAACRFAYLEREIRDI